MRVHALIVAAGRGARAGDGPAKPYRAVAGRASLARAVAAFAEHPRIERVRSVIRAEDAALYAAAVAPWVERLDPPAIGGAERQDSVRLGLEAMAEGGDPDLVLIHDAARPFVSAEVVDRTLDALMGGADGVCAALPVVDTLRREIDGGCGELVDRTGLVRAQTPQGFRFARILDAHRRLAATAVTDDAELARAAGLSVALVEGAPENIKLTTPADFAFAEIWAKGAEAPSEPPTPRIGHGYDVHRFGPNADGSSDHVMLCGVAVPHDTGLAGHSDADVGLHVLTDAVLGAIGDGDI
ncbi:MAG: 2-C-methyl-D-erythritol 4-phosphate cytidylyltransferase, partial [Pseudomonadota bacterium]